jgi:hypothetical protein
MTFSLWEQILMRPYTERIALVYWTLVQCKKLIGTLFGTNRVIVPRRRAREQFFSCSSRPWVRVLLEKIGKVPRKPRPNLQGVASVLKLLAKLGQHGLNPKASQLKTEDIVDMSLCKKFDESGFMDGRY